MKKNLFIALACSVVAVACHNSAPKNTNPGGFTINGTIKGMESGWVFFGHNDSTGPIRDSVQVANGHFTYTGKVAEPTQYYLWLMERDGRKVSPVDFFVEDTMMQININKDSLKDAAITGSPIEDQYMQYKQAIKPVRDKKMALDNSFAEASDKRDKTAIDSIEKLYGGLEKEEEETIMGYVDKNPSAFIGAWSVSKNLLYDEDVKTIQRLYAEFSPEVQQSKYGKVIKKEMDIELKMQVGMMAPEFTLNDTTGKPVSLSSFKGKYVLVDFWASWCGPCRHENPNVVKTYNMYKDKNFTVLGVSLDENKDAWEKAIKDDGLIWTHVSDLKGWQNAVAMDYGIRAIPSNYLVSPDGKILAHNLRGEELQKALAETLK
jgi:peroxiredoxin